MMTTACQSTMEVYLLSFSSFEHLDQGLAGPAHQGRELNRVLGGDQQDTGEKAMMGKLDPLEMRTMMSLLQMVVRFLGGGGV